MLLAVQVVTVQVVTVWTQVSGRCGPVASWALQGQERQKLRLPADALAASGLGAVTVLQCCFGELALFQEFPPF